VTIQRPDYFLLDGQLYTLKDDYSENYPYTHEKYGTEVSRGVSSACWRGFVAIYSIIENYMVVEYLSLRLLEVIRVNAIDPTDAPAKYSPQLSASWFNSYYSNLGLKLNYTGTIRIFRTSRLRNVFFPLQKFLKHPIEDPEKALQKLNGIVYELRTALQGAGYLSELKKIDKLITQYGKLSITTEIFAFARDIEVDFFEFMKITPSGMVRMEFDKGKLVTLYHLPILEYFDDLEKERERIDKLFK